MNRLIPLVLLAVASVASYGQTTDLDQGLSARERGEYEEAVRHLERATRADPQDEQAKIALAETLSWLERLEDAEAVYRDVLGQNPGSIAAGIGLGQVLLWQLEIDEASDRFEEVLRLDPLNADALEGAATAAWWSGDWRAAERYARMTLDSDPNRQEAGRILRELEHLSAPMLRIGATYIDDDQPYRLMEASSLYTVFSDPLTKWNFQAGSYLLDHPLRTESSPFIGISGESMFPAIDLRARGGIRGLEFPDGETELLGSVGLDWEAPAVTVSLSWQQTELLRTRAAIDDHPSVDSIELHLSRLERSGWTGSASLRSLDYYDGNRGFGADAWMLSPPLELGRLALSVGPAVSYRDTDESRFLPGFPTGVYDPYWTPEDLFEIRGIIDISASWENVIVHFHADGGWGEEKVTPEALSRNFNPWRATLSTEIPITNHWSLSAALGHETTAFYEATQLTASVARRF